MNNRYIVVTFNPLNKLKVWRYFDTRDEAIYGLGALKKNSQTKGLNLAIIDLTLTSDYLETEESK